MAKSIDERVTDLEKQNKSFKHEIERLQAINEIQNLFSTLDYFHSTAKEDEAGQLFALTMADVSAEIAGGGVYVGKESIIKVGHGVEGSGIPTPGHLGLHTRTTPVIQVAGDGKTAKGLWLSPGLETFEKDGKFDGQWCWCKYGVDFIKENGKWKIWHLHTYPIFRIPYYKSWVDAPATAALPRDLPDRLRPNKPTTYLYEYTTTALYENIPAPPQPYETWDGKTMAAP
jgi:hypothetical protein